MAGEADGEVVVPPTLQALLAARLDQLEPAERSVLERAAIEGEIFHRGAVQALAPAETQVTPHLAALVRKELIRPDRPQFAGEDGFRFRHLLIRDAAYEALPKATRADLHERLASWLEQHGSELVELDEIVGYHLEQACRYRDELGLPADDELAAAARRRLTAAGLRANLRQDYGAAVSLFERAAALVPADRARPRPRDRARRRPALDRQGRRSAPARGCPRRARLGGGRSCRRALREDPGGLVRLYLEPEGATEKLAALVEQALPVFEAAGDDLALYIAYAALAEVARCAGTMDAALEAYERAFAHARQAGHLPPGSLGGAPRRRFFGTTPVPELLAWLDENERTSRAGPLPPCLPGRGAGDARSLRRGARDPRRSACGAGGARRRNPAREHHRLRVRLSRALGRRSRRRGRVRSRRVQAARGAGGTELPVGRGREPRAGALRARPARRGRRLGRPRGGARRERRRRHGDALAAGQGEGARAPWRARRGGAARARGGRDRRGHRHARRAGRRVRRPRRGAPARRASATKRSPRSRQASSATSARATSSRRSARGRDSPSSETRRRSAMASLSTRRSRRSTATWRRFGNGVAHLHYRTET